MMLILVMAFFMLGCRFSCSGMKEGFDTSVCRGNMNCNSDIMRNCDSHGKSSEVFCAKCACGMTRSRRCARRCR